MGQPKTTGRPSAYTSDKAEEICTRISTGESLRKICDSPHLPSTTTVHRWLQDERLINFREQYAQARQQQADWYGDEVLEEADRAIAAATNAEDSKTANAIVQAHRLRMQALQWTAGQLAPKKWGTSHKSTDTTTTRKTDHEAELNKARDRVKEGSALRKLEAVANHPGTKVDTVTHNHPGTKMEPKN